MSSITPEAAIGLTAGRALSVDRIAGGGTPEWVASDAAHAAKDLERRQWIAALYRYNGDDSVRSELYGCLLNAACELAEYERWSRRVMGEKYIERLVWLAIAEEKHTIIGMHKCWPAFIRWTANDLRNLSSPETKIKRVIQEVTVTAADENVWNQVAKRYHGIYGILVCWHSETHRYMAPRLKDDAA